MTLAARRNKINKLKSLESELQQEIHESTMFSDKDKELRKMLERVTIERLKLEVDEVTA